MYTAVFEWPTQVFQAVVTVIVEHGYNSNIATADGPEGTQSRRSLQFGVLIVAFGI